MKNTLNVRNMQQLAVFELELKGQISDGMWENTPNTDWETWCKVEATVATGELGRNFPTYRDNFNLNSSFLLECVGSRMLMYARLSFEFELKDVKTLEYCFSYGEFVVMPPYGGEYWDEIRDRIEALGPEKLALAKKLVADETYDMKALNADLKDLKKIFKMRMSA